MIHQIWPYINTEITSYTSHSPYPIKDHPSGYLFNAQKGRILREYQLLYITKGKGTFASDGTPERNIGKGNLIVLFPGQWHTYSPDVQTGWNEYYIGFEGSFIDQFVETIPVKRRTGSGNRTHEELRTLFSQALDEAEADKSASQQYLSGILLHIIGMIFSISKNKEFEKDNVAEKMEQAKIIMNENVCKEMYPEELALKTEYQLFMVLKTFKKYTGYSPAKYFQGT